MDSRQPVFNLCDTLVIKVYSMGHNVTNFVKRKSICEKAFMDYLYAVGWHNDSNLVESEQYDSSSPTAYWQNRICGASWGRD